MKRSLVKKVVRMFLFSIWCQGKEGTRFSMHIEGLMVQRVYKDC